MPTPYIGECRPVGFNFAPLDWLMCQGQTLAIQEYQALFALIGTTYGGNGVTTFQLPDLQGRTPLHQGTSRSGQAFGIGQIAGSEQVTLTSQSMPTHNHKLVANGANGGSNSVQGNLLAGNNIQVYVSNPNPLRAFNPQAIRNQGGSVPHENLQPYLTITWVISLFGIFPSPN
jgi:microcystin-dependent protein